MDDDYIGASAARPGSRRAQECTSRAITEAIPFQEDGITLGPTFNLEDPDLHYVYVCIKVRNSVINFLIMQLHVTLECLQHHSRWSFRMS